MSDLIKVKIKFIKDHGDWKIGEVGETGEKSADSFVKGGYAKYLEEPKEKYEEEKDMSISANNNKELIEKYQAVNVQGIIDNILKKYHKRGFEEKEKKVWIAEIKDFLILENLDYQEKNTYTTKEERKEYETDDKNVNNFLNMKYDGEGNEISKSVDIDKVADYIIERNNVLTIFGTKNDYSFNYEGRIFVQDGRGLIKVESEKLLGKYCKRNIALEIFEKVKAKTKIERSEFEGTDINYICLDNGVWDIENKKLLSHDSKYKFKNFIPVQYIKEAVCPTWNKFINETLYPEDIPVLQEWFGFNLYREYFIKKGIICVGQKDTGKSVVLDTLINFIGEKNKTGLSLQKITSGSDFTKISLKDKHSNIYDDLSSSDLNDGGAFKVATGGGYISAEEKFGDYLQFRCFAKQMFATNKIPPVKDNDDLAYFGRWIIFNFDNVPEKLDPFLRKKLWTKKEMSGILNWALEGLYRLLESGDFSYKKNPEEIKKIMEISGCPLVAFSSEALERDDGYVITKDNMFKVYSGWCDMNGRPRMSKEMLGRQLTKYCNYILSEKHKERIWKNARIKSKYSKFNEGSYNPSNSSNNDTSDTSKNIISDISEGVNNDDKILYIKSGKVSEVSKNKKDKLKIFGGDEDE